ncbi:hypothetical protein [Sporichthya sp.]|uniref:hypothetical protein n=1 Tax=Sporichthya sp. TaxID=65475 RepID=UPI00181B3266|nr:hypothetical protein [Sporichthya sp.]MBA3742094.1 hypothetical protein [Sporichthya sp.]
MSNTGVARPRPAGVGLRKVHTPAAALRALEAATRHRLVVLGVAAVALAYAGRGGYPPPDSVPFAQSGIDLLTGRFGDVYADDYNQSGPLQLIANALFLPTGYSAVGLLIMQIVGNLVVVGALMAGSRVCRRAVGLTPSPVAELAVGLASLLWIIPGDLWSGHLAGVAIPCLWLAAAESARRDHPYLAATLLGLSAGFEPWGVLAFGVLLIERRPTVVLRAGCLAGAVAVALYAPFALTGSFHMFEHAWPVSEVSVVHLIWPDADQFTWQMRMTQGATSSLACAAVVLALRHRAGAAVWMAPLAAILFRLLLDPTVFSYYWVPVCLVALVGASTIGATSSRPAVIALLSLAYLPFVKVASATGLNLVLTISALACTVACVRRAPPAMGAAPAGARSASAPSDAARHHALARIRSRAGRAEVRSRKTAPGPGR